MTVILYSSNEEVKSFPKTLTNGSELVGNLRDECDIINPVISIVGMKPNDTFNYCYIPEFSRYYFIIDKKVITTSVVEISLHEDVLQTWSQYILQQEGVVLRNEFEYDNMLVDNIVLTKDSNTVNVLKASPSNPDTGGLPLFFPDFVYSSGYHIILKSAVAKQIQT